MWQATWLSDYIPFDQAFEFHQVVGLASFCFGTIHGLFHVVNLATWDGWSFSGNLWCGSKQDGFLLCSAYSGVLIQVSYLVPLAISSKHGYVMRTTLGADHLCCNYHHIYGVDQTVCSLQSVLDDPSSGISPYTRKWFCSKTSHYLLSRFPFTTSSSYYMAAIFGSGSYHSLAVCYGTATTNRRVLASWP